MDRDDLLLKLNEFATAVCNAMNEHHVKQQSNYAGIIAVVADDPNPAHPPIAASINYNEDEEKWKVLLQAQMTKPMYGEEVQ